MDRPRWADKDKHPTDPYAFEESDARSLSKGKAGATPGSGRLFPGDLDSVVDDFKTDNKSIGRKSYSLQRDFWLERMRKSRDSDNNFRESVLFHWSDEDGTEHQLHIVAVEGDVFETIYHGYQALFDILEGRKTVDEIQAEMTTPHIDTPGWAK